MKMMSIAPRSALLVVCSASTTTKEKAATTLKAMNLTKSNLVGAQEGQATRNIDGIIYSISYDAVSDKITIADRVNRVEYDALVGDKDNRINAILESARPLAGPPSFEQLQSVLKATGPGPEAINGRLAMVAILAAAGIELITGQPFISNPNIPAALGLAAITMAASIAPAFTSTQPITSLFPDSNNPYENSTLPYYFSPLAEAINGRAAMVGLAVVVIEELVRGTPVF